MSDGDKLLREADEAYTELRKAVDDLNDAQMADPWLGTWGVREILIHVSGWHREMIPALARIRGGEPPYPDGASYDDSDAWNAGFVARKRGVTTAEILDELEASHRDFMAAASALPGKHLAAGTAARGIVDGCGPGHYREHTAQILERRGRRV